MKAIKMQILKELIIITNKIKNLTIRRKINMIFIYKVKTIIMMFMIINLYQTNLSIVTKPQNLN